MADYDVDSKNEISRSAVLPDFPIHAGLNQDTRPRVNFIGNHGANRAERIKALGSSPLTVFLLQVTSGDIIDAGVTEYVGTNILVRADFIAAPGHHDAEFTLMVHALRDHPGPPNLSAGG